MSARGLTGPGVCIDGVRFGTSGLRAVPSSVRKAANSPFDGSSPGSHFNCENFPKVSSPHRRNPVFEEATGGDGFDLPLPGRCGGTFGHRRPTVASTRRGGLSNETNIYERRYLLGSPDADIKPHPLWQGRARRRGSPYSSRSSRQRRRDRGMGSSPTLIENKISALLADHNCSRVGISGNECWHDRAIGNSQSKNPMHT